MTMKRVILTLVAMMVAVAVQAQNGRNNAKLVRLSDKMISSTEEASRVSRDAALFYTWERDVFIEDLPDWVLDGEQILIIEHRYSWLNPSVTFYAVDSDFEGVYSKRVPYVKHVTSKRQYKKQVQEAMEENSLEPGSASDYLHLAEVAFSCADPSELDAIFKPNNWLDAFPSYYVWSIRKVNGKYYTQYYRYVGERLKHYRDEGDK